MKFALLSFLLAASVSALPGSSSSGGPGLLFRRMTCAAGLDTPCQDLCTCTDGHVSCHADPTSQCVQMCSC